ncbi:PREDICTED: kelch-like protein 26 [Acropora digitifera]|uniref:kelch-like protein 26 n=1 Tax=Acropora digitifera TaxID=70779 RepID=UPI00077A2BA0|nr:PREDICTED: kelch-like protein 26 [Acropora digitifera]
MAASGNKFPSVLKRSLSDIAEVVLFTDENHGSTILKGLFALYKDGKYADITLKIGPEQTLRAHRAVLASFSPYFEALLGDNWKERNKEDIEILGLDERAVSHLIEFAYTGKINIDNDNVQSLLEAANYLRIEFVKKSCGDFLAQGVDAKSCLGILQLADMFAMDELSSVAKKYALRHFTDVCKEDEFFCLPVNLLSDLLLDENLCVVVEDLIPCVEEREKMVLESVLQYVEHDVENRKTHLSNLLGLVRLPTLSAEYLAEVSRNKLLESEFGDILEKAKNFKLHPSEKGTPNEKWTMSRKFAEHTYTWGCAYANRGQEQAEVEYCTDKMFEDLENDCYVTGMELWIREWYERYVLGGLKVYYNNGKAIVFGQDCGGTYAETARDDHEHHEFHLEENERIVKAEIKCGCMIDRLTFYTNKKDMDGKPKCYGPYGGNGGYFSAESAPESFGYLCGVSGAVVQSHGEAGITRLQFVWRLYVLPGGNIPLKHHCIVAHAHKGDYEDEYDDSYDDINDEFDDYEDDDDFGQYDEFEEIFEFEMGAQPNMVEPRA